MVGRTLGFVDDQGIDKMALLTALCISMVMVVFFSGVFTYTRRYLMETTLATELIKSFRTALISDVIRTMRSPDLADPW